MFNQIKDDDYVQAWTKAEIETAGWEFHKFSTQSWMDNPEVEPVDKKETPSLPSDNSLTLNEPL